MPDFTFTGPQAMTYPDLKDAQGLNVGTAEPGDIRDLAEAPDHYWRETADADRAGKAEPAAAGEDGPEHDAGESGTAEGAAPDPAAPQPAPPAVVAPAAQ